jgi:hypothetical protein
MDTSVIAVSIIFTTVYIVIGTCCYYYGYYKGYKAAAEYGMSKLNEYHEYTLNKLKPRA